MRLFIIVSLFIFIETKRRRAGNRNSFNISNGQNLYGIKPAVLGTPVLFDQINREGFGDPFSEIQPPLDPLSLPGLYHYKIQLLRERKPNLSQEKNIGESNIKLPENLYNLHPDDARFDPDNDKDIEPIKKVERPMWFDLATIQQANINNYRKDNIRKVTEIPRIKDNEEPPPPPNMRITDVGGQRNQFFLPRSFGYDGTQGYTNNFTTCEEFGRKPRFHPNDIIDMDWLPFYVWSADPDQVAVIHRFTIPTKKLVTEYKTKSGPHLSKNVDWSQPKLLLTERLEMLLIAVDRRGLFHGIIEINVPSSMQGKNMKINVMTVRLKIVDPYLAIMYCDLRLATIMAVLGTGPITHADKTAEASVLKFVGNGQPVYRSLKWEQEMADEEKEFRRRIEEDKYIRVN